MCDKLWSFEITLNEINNGIDLIRVWIIIKADYSTVQRSSFPCILWYISMYTLVFEPYVDEIIFGAFAVSHSQYSVRKPTDYFYTTFVTVGENCPFQDQNHKLLGSELRIQTLPSEWYQRIFAQDQCVLKKVTL